MSPLDLTMSPPRDPRATLLGFYFIPRTIDKIRSELPGGNPGDYLNDFPLGFSPWILRELRVTMDDFRAVVARVHDEDEIAAWLRSRIDLDRAEALNAKFETFVVSRMSQENLALVRSRHPVMSERPDLDKVLDILAAEDARAFPALGTVKGGGETEAEGSGRTTGLGDRT